MTTCGGCGAPRAEPFYEVAQVPTHSVLNLPTRHAAMEIARGDVRLVQCGSCGLIENAAFDPGLSQYGEGYEETQSFSDTFQRFHADLASALIERYGLRNRTILEIGCGKGEFLALICELGGNRGIGFDPGFVESRRPGRPDLPIRFVADFFDERHEGTPADFVCCKMTLEHVSEPFAFVSRIRRAVGDVPGRLVFFQVPNASRIWDALAFWDVYYEHCNYFDRAALVSLVVRAGFDVRDVWLGYDDQYLMLTAVPASTRADGAPLVPGRSDSIARFAAEVPTLVDLWRSRMETWNREWRRVVLWGGSSKAVAFLTTLGLGEEVSSVVDINPYRQGTFVAGTGHPIVGPDTLKASPPDVVVVMNRIYVDEIGKMLAGLGIRSELVAVDPV